MPPKPVAGRECRQCRSTTLTHCLWRGPCLGFSTWGLVREEGRVVRVVSSGPVAVEARARLGEVRGDDRRIPRALASGAERPDDRVRPRAREEDLQGLGCERERSRPKAEGPDADGRTAVSFGSGAARTRWMAASQVSFVWRARIRPTLTTTGLWPDRSRPEGTACQWPSGKSTSRPGAVD